MLPGIGGILARNLVAYVGSVEEIFRSSLKSLMRIPGIGEQNAQRIRNASVLEKAEKELEYIQKHEIKAAFYTDPGYPRRLKSCVDSPILVYYKGSFEPDKQRVISIVGTRNATDYGKRVVDDLVSAFAERGYDILVVRGLAYGIDIHAHRAALKNNIPTVSG